MSIGQNTRQPEDPLLPIARICFFATCAYLIVAIILNPANNFIYNEILRFTMPNGLAAGYAPRWDDVVRALDWPAYDGAPRARTLSPIAGILDAKLKIWLAGFGVYLPTVSITWPLAFVLTPILLWQVIRRALSPTAAWIGLCFYMTATSVMSVASMTLHAGKPLNLFFCTLILWLYHRLRGHDEAGGGAVGTAGLLAAIAIAQCLALASDESALCMIGVAPVLFLEFVWRRRAGRLAAVAGIAGFGLFILWMRLALPALIAAAGYEPFAMDAGGLVRETLIRFHYPLNMATKVGWGFYATLSQPLPFFDLISWNWFPALASIYPITFEEFGDLRAGLPVDPLALDPRAVLAWAVTVFGLSVAYAATVLRRAPDERRLAGKAIIALIGIAVMQAFVLGRISFGYGLYYQGGPAALPYAVLMACILGTAVDGRRELLLRAALMAALLSGAIWNHRGEFRYWSLWDAQGGHAWLRVMQNYADIAPVFATERARLVDWAAAGGIDENRVELYLPAHGATAPGETQATYPLLHKQSLAVVMGWKPDLRPNCEVCATVGRNGILALRLTGRARNLPAPDFLGAIQPIRD